jgi:hypothetical protein
VIPDFYGPDFTKSPRAGMTMAEVEQLWGQPISRSWQVVGDQTVNIWLYRKSQKVVMPNFGGGRAYSYREYQSRTVQFLNGLVVGSTQ